jgi:uncharacterized protein with NRDE domain
MCLLAIHFQTLPAAPLLVAANREEFFDRPSLGPAIQPGLPRVLCGVDARAGGTWLGVNEYGLFVAVTNRPKSDLPTAPRSRGALCRDLLACRSAEEAAKRANTELATGHYAGANYVVADTQSAFAIQAGDALVATPLTPGLHLLTNGDLNDPRDARQKLARELFARQPFPNVQEFLDVAARVCATGPDPRRESTILVRTTNRGTVSSTLVALAADPSESAYRHAPAAPDRAAYEDYSTLLRGMLRR